MKRAPILIVDDDEDIRELVKILLEADGYQVITAADGVDAFQQLRASGGVSLILLDLMMPRMDGEQFLQTLRASADAGVPVVVMSGQTAAREHSRELRANECLTKPVDLQALLGAVHKFVPPEKHARH